MGNKKTEKPTFESMSAHFFGYSKSNEYIFVKYIVAFNNDTEAFWVVRIGHYESKGNFVLSSKNIYDRAGLLAYLEQIGLRL